MSYVKQLTVFWVRETPYPLFMTESLFSFTKFAFLHAELVKQTTYNSNIYLLPNDFNTSIVFTFLSKST